MLFPNKKLEMCVAQSHSMEMEVQESSITFTDEMVARWLNYNDNVLKWGIRNGINKHGAGNATAPLRAGGFRDNWTNTRSHCSRYNSWRA